MADAVLAGMDATVPDADWREQVRVLAHRYRAQLKSRRDAARLIAGRFVSAPCRRR